MNRLMTKPTKWHVCPMKTQISLGICTVWSESLLCAQWVAKDLSLLHVDSEDPDQTGQSLHWAHMPFCWFCHEAAQICYKVFVYSKKYLAECFLCETPLSFELPHDKTNNQQRLISVSCPHEEAIGSWLSLECTAKTDKTGQMPRQTGVFDGCMSFVCLFFCHAVVHFSFSSYRPNSFHCQIQLNLNTILTLIKYLVLQDLVQIF